MSINAARQSFSALDLTTRSAVLNYTAARDGLLGLGLLVPSGLTTGSRTVFEIDATVDRGNGEKQAEHTAINKRTSGDTSILRRSIITLPVKSGDVVRLYVKSQNSGDTSVSGDGTVWWQDMGVPADAATVDGVSQKTLMEMLLAYLASPNATVTDNGDGTKTLTFRDQSDSNDVFDVTFNQNGEFTASTIS